MKPSAELMRHILKVAALCWIVAALMFWVGAGEGLGAMIIFSMATLMGVASATIFTVAGSVISVLGFRTDKLLATVLLLASLVSIPSIFLMRRLGYIYHYGSEEQYEYWKNQRAAKDEAADEAYPEAVILLRTPQRVVAKNLDYEKYNFDIFQLENKEVVWIQSLTGLTCPGKLFDGEAHSRYMKENVVGREVAFIVLPKKEFLIRHQASLSMESDFPVGKLGAIPADILIDGKPSYEVFCK